MNAKPKTFAPRRRRDAEKGKLGNGMGGEHMIPGDGLATGKKLIHEKLPEQIIGAAMEVHKALGPGLMESVYEECLCFELNLRRLAFPATSCGSGFI